MKKGGVVSPYFIFLGLAALMLVGAFLASSHTASEEDSTLDRIQSSVKQTADRFDTFRSSQENQDKAITSLSERLTKIEDKPSDIQSIDDKVQRGIAHQIGGVMHKIQSLEREIEILKVQQHTLDKRIIAKEQQLNIKILKESDPIPVQVPPKKVEQPQGPQTVPLPKGKGQEALLKRSGVKKVKE